MKVYVVTSLIDNQDEEAEVNIIGVAKTYEDARKLMDKAIGGLIDTYSDNNFDYEINKWDDNTKVVKANFYKDVEDFFDDDVEEAFEAIEFQIWEREV